MRHLLVLAAAAAAASLPTSASATCTPLVTAGGNSVALCREREWERERIYYTCTIDTNFDGRPDLACEPLVVVEIYG